MADPKSGPHVVVTLRDVDHRDPIPTRSVVLRAPAWQVKIGRGTQSGNEGLIPTQENAWFDSRVMSRSHALLLADPASQELFIEDLGSMHGTYLAGRRLVTNCAEILHPNDVLTMGANVTRGSSFFNALNVQISWDWRESGSSTDISHHPDVITSRNTFSADYSEDERYDDPSSEILGDQDEDEDEDEDEYEIYEVSSKAPEPNDDDEVQVVQDSIRQRSVEIVMPPTSTFTVPESDDGSPRGTWVSGEEEDNDEEDDDLLFSENSLTDEESPFSSPTTSKKPDEANPTDNSAFAPSSPLLDTLFTNRTTANPSHRQAHDPIDMSEAAGFDSDGACDGDSYADDELDHEYSDPPEQVDIPTTQGENYEPNNIEIFTSAKASHLPARPPSPSDAAMAKPSGEPMSSISSGAPPFSPCYNSQPYRQPSSCVNDITVSGRSSSAWAGHNSILYDPVPRPSMQQPQSQPPSQQPALYYPGYMLPASSIPAFTSQDTAMSVSAPPASHVSIASLVQPQQLQAGSDRSKKRKADQISSDSFDTSQSPPTSLSNMVPCGAGALDIELPKAPNSVIDVAATASTDSIETQSRKKVKKTNIKAEGLPRSSFVKMTAATIAGMAIGAVGTIIGLAALPQDYFA